ncbi:MAG: hypothetical protein VX378_06280 [Pseudomonadota bacterium]|nr:hypothetical protein [Pseudomonadota bacterium]
MGDSRGAAQVCGRHPVCDDLDRRDHAPLPHLLIGRDRGAGDHGIDAVQGVDLVAVDQRHTRFRCQQVHAAREGIGQQHALRCHGLG